MHKLSHILKNISRCDLNRSISQNNVDGAVASLAFCYSSIFLTFGLFPYPVDFNLPIDVSFYLLRSRYRKVTIWARVQVSPGEKVVEVLPEVIFPATAQATALA